MKKVFVILALLLAIGGVAGYVLIPREKEIALTQYKEQVWDFDKQAYKSKDVFVRQFEEGDRSIDVVKPLVDIYLQEGNVNQAIVVLESYVAENPDSVSARRQLGTLYQYAQRPADYQKNLEEISKISGNQNVLRDLSDIYSFNEEYAKKSEVMQTMIESKQPLEISQFIELANLQASSKETQQAIATLQALRDSHPDAVPYEAVRLMTSLQLDIGEKDKALEQAQWWKEKTANMDEIAQLANMLHYKGSPELAEKYLESYGEDVFKHPSVAAEKVLVLVVQGKDSEAYEALVRLDSEGALPEGLIDTFLLLALRQGDEEQIAGLLERITPETVEEPQAIAIVEVARSMRRTDIVRSVAQQLGTPQYRQAHPLFSLVLGLALAEADMENKVTAFLDENAVTDPQRLMLARACAASGKSACVSRLIDELKDGEIDNPRLASLGGLYLDIRRYADGLALMEAHRNADSSVDVELIWVRLLAANGRADAVVDWLTKHENLHSEALLSDLYFLANDNGHKALALDMAALLHQTADTSQTRSYLAYSYIQNGRFEEALTLLKEAGELNDDIVDAYLSALIAQAKRDPSYRDELTSFATQQLASGEVSPRRKLALVYALIDGGRSDIAMPYIREYALRSGGDWVVIYAENLDKAGKYEEAREFWLMAAKRPGIGIQEKRNIAFSLLQRGYDEDAARIFEELAASEPPTGDNVRQLLYVWGPRLDERQLAWVYARAEAATDPAERQAWLDIVMNGASSDGVLALTAAHPEALNEPQVLDAYLRAQYGLRNEEALDGMLLEMREEKYAPDMVRAYARFSRDYNMPRRSAEAYRQLLAMSDNKDEEALREAGLMAYGRADYSEARQYLGNYLYLRQDALSSDKDQYLASFYYAEILRRDKRYEDAQKYYQATLNLIQQETARSPEMESKAQQSLVWIGNIEGGMQGFRDAIEHHPADDVLRADFVSTLVENKRYDEARKVLAMPRPVMDAALGAELPLEFSSRQFSAYKLSSDRKELLLAYDPALTPQPGVNERTAAEHPWVSYVTQGHDVVLLTAKYEYVMEVVKRSDGGFTIVPRKDEVLATSQLQAQSNLRYELLRARIELENGEQYAASKRLNKLLPNYPQDSQLLGFTANAENYVGRWQRALKLLRQAETISPDNEDIAILKRDIEREHAQHVKLDHEWRALGDHDEQVTTLSGFATVADGMDIGAVIQNNQVDSASLRRADGRIGEFSDSKQRGELFGRYVDDEGTAYKLSLFANNDTLGLGGYVDFINRLGISGVAVELRRPYWEFVEGVLDDATRDRLEIHHVARIDRQITVEANASVNRYNVDVDNDVATSAGFAATVGYQFMDDPLMSVLYGLDAEYELDHSERTDATGASYRPFPFRSREVHSLALAGRYDFTEETYAEYMAGYAFDRLGGNGPVAELRITHEIDENLEAQGRAFYGLGAGETDDDVKRLGAYLMYRY